MGILQGVANSRIYGMIPKTDIPGKVFYLLGLLDMS